MKTYDVIVRLVNNVYVAVVPALPGIRVEGTTRDDALFRVKQAIEDYFKSAEVVSLPIDVPVIEFRPHATANDELRAAALTQATDDIDAEQLVDIYAERRRQREEMIQQDDWQVMQVAQQQRRLEDLKRYQLDQKLYRTNRIEKVGE